MYFSTEKSSHSHAVALREPPLKHYFIIQQLTINMQNKKILVVGSISWDVIFSVKGRINDNIHIKKGKLGMQSMMFVAGDKKEFYGGTGANISYGAGILGGKPVLFSLAGKDFEGDFKNHLKKSGVDLKVTIDKKGFTADFYGITDDVGEQIGIWQPNAYSEIEKIKLTDTISISEIKKFGVAIFSPGSPKSIQKHMQEFKKHADKEATVIFDPGQVIAYFSKQDFLKCLKLCDIFISNEVEMKQAEKIIGKKLPDLLNHLGKIVIETKSKEGSTPLP